MVLPPPLLVLPELPEPPEVEFGFTVLGLVPPVEGLVLLPDAPGVVILYPAASAICLTWAARFWVSG